MTLREGNLEAPTRHPIDWQGADYYDEAKTFAEMERVFDICHGCRRCVSLCQSFPNLFDLVDATADGEVHGVDKKDYAKVVDQCYLCDLCYMTKCPYVPPHPWQVDFPHLMLRAKAIKYRKGEVGGGEKLLAATDVHGQFAGIPIVSQAVNAANRTQPVRKVLDGALGVHPDAWLPALATKRFRSAAAKSNGEAKVVDGERSPGKVAVFSTCFVNYNEPGIGHDLLRAARAQRHSLRDRREGELLRHAQARARRPRRRGQAQGRQHPGAGALCQGGLGDRLGGPVLHPDVQAGAAADVPRRGRREGGAGGDVRSVRVPRSRATATAC